MIHTIHSRTHTTAVRKCGRRAFSLTILCHEELFGCLVFFRAFRGKSRDGKSGRERYGTVRERERLRYFHSRPMFPDLSRYWFLFPRFPYHRKMNCSRPTSRPTICTFASHPVPDFDTLSPVPLPWLSLLVVLVLIITMVVRTLKGKGEADVAGWQLVKCTSTYFVSFIDTIKKCNYLRRIWSFCRTGGRQIPS